MTIRREMAEWRATCVTCEPCPYLSHFSRQPRLSQASTIAAEALKNNADYAGTNFSATPLMQYRNPVGFGPSLKICP